jgi:hypothetical protein
LYPHLGTALNLFRPVVSIMRSISYKDAAPVKQLSCSLAH